MAVHINVALVPDDGGKPWKHLDARCQVLLAGAAADFPVETI